MDGVNVTVLSEPSVLEASAAVAEATDGATSAEAAFSTAAVGRSHCAPRGEPVHSAEIGAMAPRAHRLALVEGTLVRGLIDSMCPIRFWSPCG